MRIRTGLATTALFGLLACSSGRPATVGGTDSGARAAPNPAAMGSPIPQRRARAGPRARTPATSTRATTTTSTTTSGASSPRRVGRCPDPRPGTDVKGTGPLGEFDGNVAYLGEWWGQLHYFRLVVFDKSADLDAEIDYAWKYWDFVDQGPALVITPNFDEDYPPATTVDAIGHFVARREEYFMGSITVDEVIEYEDLPDFPAIMSGRFDLWPDDMSDGVSGPFVAVYCRAFDDMIIAE